MDLQPLWDWFRVLYETTGIKLPIFLAPRSQAREWEEGGRFRFNVSIAMPLIGDIVHYDGWLTPISKSGPDTPPCLRGCPLDS